MAELTFARQFLSALDSRPVKLASDHVADPRSYPAQTPYILPKMPVAKRKRSAEAADSINKETSATGITVTMKALRADAFVLKDQTPTTSVYELKVAFSEHFGVEVGKVRVLKDKKPVGDSKILKEVVGEELKEVELGVVLLPGAQLKKPEVAASKPAPAPAAAVVKDASEPVNEAGEVLSKEALRGSGKGELETEQFWNDLKGFLTQRLRDEGEGSRMAGVFREAYQKSR